MEFLKAPAHVVEALYEATIKRFEETTPIADEPEE
jgi:hypothetical protein